VAVAGSRAGLELYGQPVGLGIGGPDVSAVGVNSDWTGNRRVALLDAFAWRRAVLRRDRFRDDIPYVQTEHSVLKGHADLVEQLVWHPHQKDIVATVSSDKTVRVWDARSTQWDVVLLIVVIFMVLGLQLSCAGAKAASTITTNNRNINVAWSRDGEHVAVGSKVCCQYLLSLTL
jgi:WD40 repeat protein